MQGASPLASPRLNPGGTGFSFGKQRPKGGLSPGLPAGSAVPVPEGGLVFRLACLPCHLFTVFPPSPRPPSRREGGESRLFHARGFAPCIPEAEPGRHGLFLWKAVPQGGLVPGVAVRACRRCPRRGGVPGWLPADLATNLPSCPHPPDPLPSGKGETFHFISPGAGAPGTPAAESGRHGLNLRGRYPKGGLRILHLRTGIANAAWVQAGFKTHSRSG